MRGPASVVAPNSKVRITVLRGRRNSGRAPLEVPVDASGNWQFPAPSSAGRFKFSAETVNGFSRSGAVALSVDVSRLAAPAITSPWTPTEGPALHCHRHHRGHRRSPARTVRLSGDFTGTGTRRRGRPLEHQRGRSAGLRKSFGHGGAHGPRRDGQPRGDPHLYRHSAGSGGVEHPGRPTPPPGCPASRPSPAPPFEVPTWPWPWTGWPWTPCRPVPVPERAMPRSSPGPRRPWPAVPGGVSRSPRNWPPERTP